MSNPRHNNSSNNQRNNDQILNNYNRAINVIGRNAVIGGDLMFDRPRREARLHATPIELQIMRVPFTDYRSEIAREQRRK